MKKTYVVGITGASGSIYGVRLIQTLMEQPVRLFLILSESGKSVLAHEMGCDEDLILEKAAYRNGSRHIDQEASIEICGNDQLFSPSASGSFIHHGMAIIPCSMKTLAAIASGFAENLIYRSADVCLKERRPLVLVTRETPLNLIHIQNMERAARAGATILPACPGFYNGPETVTEVVDTVVARVLDHLYATHDISVRWGESDV